MHDNNKSFISVAVRNALALKSHTSKRRLCWQSWITITTVVVLCIRRWALVFEYWLGSLSGISHVWRSFRGANEYHRFRLVTEFIMSCVRNIGVWDESVRVAWRSSHEAMSPRLVCHEYIFISRVQEAKKNTFRGFPFNSNGRIASIPFLLSLCRCLTLVMASKIEDRIRFQDLTYPKQTLFLRISQISNFPLVPCPCGVYYITWMDGDGRRQTRERFFSFFTPLNQRAWLLLQRVAERRRKKKNDCFHVR